MEILTLLSQNWTFLLLIGLGCYVQAVMGFAGGLVVVGGVALFGMMDIDQAAIVMSFVTLFNAMVALQKNRAEIRGRWVFAILLGALPATLLGVMLLEYLSTQYQSGLKIALGLVIMFSCMTLVLKRPELKTTSSMPVFFIYGIITGIVGGLFATFGPVLVYLLYRQPVEMRVIRDTLLSIFAVTAIGRLLFVIVRDEYTQATFELSLLALPVVVISTWVARQFLPPFSDLVMKRIAFVILMISSLVMIIPNIGSL